MSDTQQRAHLLTPEHAKETNLDEFIKGFMQTILQDMVELSDEDKVLPENRTVLFAYPMGETEGNLVFRVEFVGVAEELIHVYGEDNSGVVH